MREKPLSRVPCFAPSRTFYVSVADNFEPKGGKSGQNFGQGDAAFRPKKAVWPLRSPWSVFFADSELTRACLDVFFSWNLYLWDPRPIFRSMLRTF